MQNIIQCNRRDEFPERIQALNQILSAKALNKVKVFQNEILNNESIIASQ